MNTRIDSNFPLESRDLYGADRASPALEGEYKGQKVSTRSQSALFSDAAEELSFAGSEKAEKSLKKRKIGAGSKHSRMLEKARAYLKRLPDLGSLEKLKEFAEHLKKQQNLTPDKALSEAKKFFKDVSHQHAALTFVRETADSKDGSRLDSLLSDALRQMEDRDGPEIRAGMNVSETAQRFSEEGLGRISDLRAFYRDVILSQKDATGIFNGIKKNFKDSEFERCVKFLIKALGKDIQAMGPSVSPAALKTVMDHLYLLESIRNMDKDCEALKQKMDRKSCMEEKTCQGDLTGYLLDLKNEQWPRSEKVTAAAEGLGVRGDNETTIECQIYFLREMRELMRKIPIKLFSSLEDRERVLDAMQEALDVAIDKEEEMLS